MRDDVKNIDDWDKVSVAKLMVYLEGQMCRKKGDTDYLDDAALRSKYECLIVKDPELLNDLDGEDGLDRYELLSGLYDVLRRVYSLAPVLPQEEVDLEREEVTEATVVNASEATSRAVSPPRDPPPHAPAAEAALVGWLGSYEEQLLKLRKSTVADVIAVIAPHLTITKDIKAAISEAIRAGTKRLSFGPTNIDAAAVADCIVGSITSSTSDGSTVELKTTRKRKKGRAVRLSEDTYSALGEAAPAQRNAFEDLLRKLCDHEDSFIIRELEGATGDEALVKINTLDRNVEVFLDNECGNLGQAFKKQDDLYKSWKKDLEAVRVKAAIKAPIDAANKRGDELTSNVVKSLLEDLTSSDERCREEAANIYANKKLVSRLKRVARKSTGVLCLLVTLLVHDEDETRSKLGGEYVKSILTTWGQAVQRHSTQEQELSDLERPLLLRPLSPKLTDLVVNLNAGTRLLAITLHRDNPDLKACADKLNPDYYAHIVAAVNATTSGEGQSIPQMVDIMDCLHELDRGRFGIDKLNVSDLFKAATCNVEMSDKGVQFGCLRLLLTIVKYREGGWTAVRDKLGDSDSEVHRFFAPSILNACLTCVSSLADCNRRDQWARSRSYVLWRLLLSCNVESTMNIINAWIGSAPLLTLYVLRIVAGGWKDEKNNVKSIIRLQTLYETDDASTLVPFLIKCISGTVQTSQDETVRRVAINLYAVLLKSTDKEALKWRGFDVDARLVHRLRAKVANNNEVVPGLVGALTLKDGQAPDKGLTASVASILTDLLHKGDKQTALGFARRLHAALPATLGNQSELRKVCKLTCHFLHLHAGIDEELDPVVATLNTKAGGCEAAGWSFPHVREQLWYAMQIRCENDPPKQWKTDTLTVTLYELCEQLSNACFDASGNSRWTFDVKRLVALADRLGLRPFAPSAILATFRKLNSHRIIPKEDPMKRMWRKKERVREMLSTYSATTGWGKSFVETLTPSVPATKALTATPPPTAVAPASTALVAVATPTPTVVAPASAALVPSPPPAVASKDAARVILSRRVRQRIDCEECQRAFGSLDEREAFANNKTKRTVLGCKRKDHSLGMTSDLVTMVRGVYPSGLAVQNIYNDVFGIMEELFQSTDGNGSTTGLTPLGKKDSKQKYQVTLVKPDGENERFLGVKNCRFPGVMDVDAAASQLTPTHSAGNDGSAPDEPVEAMGAGSAASPAKRRIDEVGLHEASSQKAAKRTETSDDTSDNDETFF